jgi:predicted phosphodiesterase
MKLLILSDPHLEFHQDGGREFLRTLDPWCADTLVVAGDLCSVWMLPGVVRVLCERFAHVVYVAGNHEYYGSDPEEVECVLADLGSHLPGFHWLHETRVVIDGVRIGGTTLWFPDGPQNEQFSHLLSDFSQIRGFREWVYPANGRAVRFLQERASTLDVVVTHHLPARGSVNPGYAGSPLNLFFLCDVGSLMAEAQPQLWIHGHTHGSCDYLLGRTRVVCNPFGYSRENVDFNARLVVDVVPGRQGRRVGRGGA